MRAISLVVPSNEAELGADRLWSAGARAVEERDAGAGAVELVTTLGDHDGIARERLGDVPDHWIVSFAEVSESATEAWRDHVAPVRVRERLVIHPAWMPVDPEAGVLAIAIDPRRSFGLGDHPTTRLSAAVLDELVDVGDRVLDVGCGSGVLAILAARRGAGRVEAIDLSEAAREATLANAAANGCADRIAVSTTPVGAVTGEFDVVVANILAPALVSMAAELRRLTAAGGRLVVSGVLTGGYDHVVGALAPLQVVEDRHLDGWSAVTLRRRVG